MLDDAQYFNNFYFNYSKMNCEKNYIKIIFLYFWLNTNMIGGYYKLISSVLILVKLSHYFLSKFPNFNILIFASNSNIINKYLVLVNFFFPYEGSKIPSSYCWF